MSVTPIKRAKLELTPQQRRISTWAKKNYGVVTKLAREFNLSPTFVHRVMYNRDAKSKGFAVERKLKSLGCPLIQKIN
jgi:hypothetical protein